MNILAEMVRLPLRLLFGWLFKVRVIGASNFKRCGEQTLIVANHVSRIDGLLLYLFLPHPLVFAVDPATARMRFASIVLRFVETIEMDRMNPHALKGVIRLVKNRKKVLIFPEGRATSTGSLMKIYEGPAMVADVTGADILPVAIEGLQYSKYSLLRGLVRIRTFPSVKIVILEPRKVALPPGLPNSSRRGKAAGEMLALMREIAFECAYEPVTLYRATIDAMYRHGPNHTIIEDSTGASLSYRQLLLRANVLAQFIAADSERGECVGIMLPSTAAAIVTLTAAQSRSRISAMLNFTAGVRGLVIACETADVHVVYTSRKFVAEANLEKEVAALEEVVRIVYLEDLRDKVGVIVKLRAAFNAFFPRLCDRLRNPSPDCEAASIVLFTSGSEGIPKGVVLTHANIVANRAQVQTLIDLTHKDVVLNVLPTFHAFGLLGGVLLPLLDGARIYCYPSPLHYRIIPELSYQLGATCLFGTNTFLAGYAKYGHPYDFHKLRFVIAGAEKLNDETRRLWFDKFGIRIFEGYGATEASPVIAVNTPMGNKPNTVGTLLAKMEHYLEPVEGIAQGGRLVVRGPNVMRGYLFHGGDGEYYPPSTDQGQGWYDTGDIVDIDDEGFIAIVGRHKRFAKIGGEMVSLAQTEEVADAAWPETAHAAVTLPDQRKGEQIILLSEAEDADRSVMVAKAKELGVSELTLPKKIIHAQVIPLLGSGKVDYPALRELAKELIES